MSVLVIGEEDREKIRKMVALARAQPTPWARMKELIVDDRGAPTDKLELVDRKVEVLEKLHRDYPVQHLMLGTVQVAFSFEEQPGPEGTGLILLRHISVSVDKKGLMPHERAVEMIAGEFGFSGWPPRGRVWIEEYEAGKFAVNVAEIVSDG